MSPTNAFKVLSSKIDVGGETVLTVFFLITSLYMYYNSWSYMWSGRLFPQIAALIVLIGAALLLVERHLPGPIRNLTSESVDVSPELEDVVDEPDEEIQENPNNRFGIPGTFIAVIMTALYIIIGYAIGLLWATPIFVLMYTIWFRLPWHLVIFLSIISFGLAYLFMEMLNLQLQEGVLTSFLFVEVIA